MVSTTHFEVDAGDAALSCALYGAPLHGAGPLVVCAHGFPDCARTFREQVPALVEAGYRVAVPTMRGYAPSTPSREGRYDPMTLGRDLLAVAAQFAPNERVFLVGHDWGAVAAYAAATLAAERVRGLVTMAVPPLRIAALRFLRPAQLQRSWYIGLFQLGAHGLARLVANDLALVAELWRSWSPGYACPADELEHIKAAIRPHPNAVLGYYRAIATPSVLFGRAGRVVLEPLRVPSYYLHGADDGCVGAELARDLEPAYRAGLTSAILPGCGHFLHLERPEVVNRRLIAFLRDCG